MTVGLVSKCVGLAPDILKSFHPFLEVPRGWPHGKCKSKKIKIVGFGKVLEELKTG